MTHTWLIISKTNQLSILIDFLLGLRSVIDKNISLFNKSTLEITGIRNISLFSILVLKEKKLGEGIFLYERFLLGCTLSKNCHKPFLDL